MRNGNESPEHENSQNTKMEKHLKGEDPEIGGFIAIMTYFSYLLLIVVKISAYRSENLVLIL